MLDKQTLQDATELLRIGNKAVQKAQQANLKKGIPNVYSKNGTIYYQLPDLSITTESPFLPSI